MPRKQRLLNVAPEKYNYKGLTSGFKFVLMPYENVGCLIFYRHVIPIQAS